MKYGLDLQGGLGITLSLDDAFAQWRQLLRSPAKLAKSH